METKKIIRAEIGLEELNPTFLFAWRDACTEADEKDRCHDYSELVYILSGELIYYINGKEYKVSEGDFLVINPGDEHRVARVSDCESQAGRFLVGFTDIQVEGFAPNMLPVPEAGPVMHTSGELRQRILRICSSMDAENAVYRQGRYFMLKSYLMQLLLLVIREQCEPVPAPKGYSFESVNRKYVVEQMLHFFESHYSEKISLDQIAENMYLSPFYISKIFKSETGETPIRHLINIRLEKAREILESGESGNIQEVAASVGYDDAYHFSKLFKKRYGISPSQAKRKA